MKKLKILVTGAGGASGICTILILKESTNHIIVGCDCDGYSSGLYLADEKFIIPPAKNEGKFLKELIKKIKKYKIDVVFPNVDEELLIFAKNKPKIPCEVVISPLSTIEICRDKSRLFNKLENVVPLPSTKNISPPFFLKPKIGRGSKNIYKVDSEKELRILFKYLSLKRMNEDDFIVQEFLPGKEYTVDALFNKDGKLVAAVPRERIRVFGSASLIGKTEKNYQIIKFVRKISTKLKFFGPVNFQFKEDKEGVPKLIEINPRCSGGMAITYRSGINLPKLTLTILEREKISKQDLQWKEKIVFRYLTEI